MLACSRFERMQVSRSHPVSGVGQRYMAAKPAAVRWPDILMPGMLPAAKRASPGRCNARKGRGGTRMPDEGVTQPVHAQLQNPQQASTRLVAFGGSKGLTA